MLNPESVMPSLLREGKTGKRVAYAIEFNHPAGGRKRWRLGQVPRPLAQEALRHIRSIEASAALGDAFSVADREWLAALSSTHLERLRRTGILDGTGVLARLTTLGQWVDSWLSDVSASCSERTHALYQATGERLIRFFGAGRSLSGFSRDDAAAFRASLVDAGLAEATIRQQIRQAKVCFSTACKRDLLSVNPFDRLSSASLASKRERFISAAEAHAVIAELPTAAHAVLFAFARFAGLRIPTETEALRWENIDASAGRFRVFAQKTGVERECPLFVEVHQVLIDAFGEPFPASGAVLRLSSNNLARTVANAARRAGVEPWPRTFQALRQSCVTDLRDRFPEHVVAAWCGHSQAVATRHYAMVHDEHFARAAGKVSRNPSCISEELGGIQGKPSEVPGRSDRRKSVFDGNLRNGPARIRTGDQAIMSRSL